MFHGSDNKLSSLLRQFKGAIAHRDEKYKADKAKGAFLPKEVWEAKGFTPPPDFETTCPNSHKEWHEQLQCWTYNVELHEAEDVRKRGQSMIRPSSHVSKSRKVDLTALATSTSNNM